MRFSPSRAITNAFSQNKQHRTILFPAATAIVAVASLVVPYIVRTASTSSPPLSASSAMPASPEERKTRLVYGSDDVLFGHIEAQQGTKPFGSFLDAGTGVHSLRWIATLASASGTEDEKEDEKKSITASTMTDFTAVTADETMRKNVQKEVDELGVSDLGNVVIGNWFPPNGNDKVSLSSIDYDEAGNLKLYDTILADYLIGAMDGFSPYAQDQMIDKLAQRLKPGGRLYIVGLQPIPDSYGSKDSPQNVICDVRKARDACILLSGDRCYREYPLDWIQRQIAKTGVLPSGDGNEAVALNLLDSKTFPILYRHTTIVKQINVGRSKLKRFPSQELASEMRKTLDDLERRSKEATDKSPKKRIQLGFDYVCVSLVRPE